MKLIYFSQFYKPESIAPAFRASENAKIWSNLGHAITVFTGYPNYPKGKIFEGYIPKLLTEEKDGEIRVIRSKLVAKENTNFFRRLINAFSYYFYGLINIIINKNIIGVDYDIVLGTSGVIFNALLAYQFSKKIKKPFIFELRDITYIQLQATGKKRSSFTVRAMKFLELYLCRKASMIVTVTDGFKEILVQDGIEDKKIDVITNGVDISECKKTGKDKFVLSYFGTIGVSQNITETFEYASIIREFIDGFEYLIIGDGAQKNIVYEEAQKYDFVNMLPGMPADELESYYMNTELSIVTLVNNDKFKYTIPSKLFQIMGRGIAVLYIGPCGEVEKIVVNNHCGIALTGTKEENTASIKKIFSNDKWKDEIKIMGENGRKLVGECYNRTKLAIYYAKSIEKIIN